MPIDTNKSHGTIVKELIDAYRATGKIGATTPRNLEHAVRVANTIAYKAKEESILLQMTDYNEDYAKQLTIDVQQNIADYANSVVRKNEVELATMVKDFIHDYSLAEQRRLRSFGKLPNYKLPVEYDTRNIKTLDLAGFKIPIGYRQELGTITKSLAESVLKHNGYFYSRLQDSTLLIEITASYLESINKIFKELSA